MSCKYQIFAAEPWPGHEWYNVGCEIVDGIAGHTCGLVNTSCAKCRYAEGDDSVVIRLGKSHIRTRLIAGDLPCWNKALDMIEKFGRFVNLSTKDEQAKVVKKMYRFQSEIIEEDGGLSPDQLGQKLVAVCEAHDDDTQHLSKALQEAVDEAKRIPLEWGI